MSSCFVIPFSIVITSLGEEGAGLCASRAFVCLLSTCQFLSFFSSSWCRGLAAVCDCGTPWTFLLTYLMLFSIEEFAISNMAVKFSLILLNATCKFVALEKRCFINSNDLHCHAGFRALIKQGSIKQYQLLKTVTQL